MKLKKRSLFDILPGVIALKSLTLKSRIIQSPMAGCTDLAFRLTARRHGMEFAFLEMVSAEALVRKNQRTFELLKTVEEDRPLGAQIVGCHPEVMGEAAAVIEGLGFDLIDINLGCPVPKIVSPGGGSALLREPERARRIFESVVRNVKRIPVTVKMRKGFSDPSGEEAVQIARIAEDCGLSAVTVHGRTRLQGYAGRADWEAIGKVKRAVNIPVFGNGDVASGQDAEGLLEASGCDGIMLGRGSLGNPWIYRSIEACLARTPPPSPPSLEERKRTLLSHIALEIETEGERTGLLKSRHIACWYLKDYAGAAELRHRIHGAQTRKEMEQLIESLGACS